VLIVAIRHALLQLAEDATSRLQDQTEQIQGITGVLGRVRHQITRANRQVKWVIVSFTEGWAITFVTWMFERSEE
jgi:hypothetical protein